MFLTHLSLINGFPKNYAVTKVGYKEIGMKQLKNAIHNLEVVELRSSLRRATGQRIIHVTIRRGRCRQRLKPFHVIAKSLKTNTHIEDRKWLANFVADWTEEDFLHIVPSDEFDIYVIRKPNHQNDRIWAKKY